MLEPSFVSAIGVLNIVDHAEQIPVGRLYYGHQLDLLIRTQVTFGIILGKINIGVAVDIENINLFRFYKLKLLDFTFMVELKTFR